MKIMTPIGLPYGLGCHFPPAVAGGVLPMWLFQNVTMALGFNHLAEVVRSKPGRRIYGENATYPPILVFLGLFAYPTPRG